MRDKKWQKLEDAILQDVREIDKYAQNSPGSGNQGIKGDIYTTNLGLNIECKCYQKKNVWEVEWLNKCEEEIPLHSDRTAIVVTENNEGKRHVHLTWDDFWSLYKRSLNNENL